MILDKYYPKRIGKVSDKKRSSSGFFAAVGREGSGDFDPFMADVRPCYDRSESIVMGKMRKGGFLADKKRLPGRSDDRSVRVLADDRPRVGQTSVKNAF